MVQTDPNGPAVAPLAGRVQTAMTRLADGLLAADPPLAEALCSGAEPADRPWSEVELVTLALVVWAVAEDTGRLHTPAAPASARTRYAEAVSSARLRAAAAQTPRGEYHSGGWWPAVTGLLADLGSGEGRPELGLPGVGGLFAAAAATRLAAAPVDDVALLAAVRALDPQPESGGGFADVGSRDLGAAHEAVVGTRPAVAGDPPRIRVGKGGGHRGNGCYYTPEPVVAGMLNLALDPVVDRYAAHPDPANLLQILVCDPACGAGVFLVDAAGRIARRYAARTFATERPLGPLVTAVLPDVLTSCIFGLDIDPVAVEVTKAVLWLPVAPRMPMFALDGNIECGDPVGDGASPSRLDQRLHERGSPASPEQVELSGAGGAEPAAPAQAARGGGVW